MTHIGRRRDDRNTSESRRKVLYHFIGPADVPGQQRDAELSSLVYHNDRRIRALIPNVRRDRANRDARCSYKNEGVAGVKALTGPLLNRDTQFPEACAGQILALPIPLDLHIVCIPGRE